MTEFLGNNWLWILLGIGVLWFLVRGRGMGCGMGGHSHGSEPSRKGEANPHAGHAADTGATHQHGSSDSVPPRRRGGCC